MTGTFGLLGSPGLGVEEELCLRLLGRHVTPAERWDELVVHADWHHLLDIAGLHLIPYLAHRLEICALPAKVPEPAARRIRDAHRSGAIMHFYQRSALRGVGRALANANIPAIALKGLALAEGVYTDPLHRLMGDIDLWLAEGDLDRAVAILRPEGFEIPDRYDRLASGADERSGHRSLIWRTAPVLLELHAPPASFERLSDARRRMAWERSVPSKMDGIALRRMCREDLLIHAALHTTRHRFANGLRALVDIQLLLDHPGGSWNWAEMAADYRAERIEVAMFVALTLARDLLGAVVPDDWSDHELPAPTTAEIRRHAVQRLLTPRIGPLPPILKALAQRGTRAERLRYTLRRLTTYYLSTSRPPGQTLFRSVIDALGRVGLDLRVKVPKYWRLWRNGALRGNERRRRAADARDASRLEKLFAAAEQEIRKKSPSATTNHQRHLFPTLPD